MPPTTLTRTKAAERLLGFWVCWHALGGDAALLAAGWSRTTLYRSQQEFKVVTGKTVQEFQLFDDVWQRLPHGRPAGVEDLWDQLPIVEVASSARL